MKKLILFVFLTALFTGSVLAADQWAVTEPLGTRDAADIDTYIGVNNAALDRLAIKYRKDCTVMSSSATGITVNTGEIAISNAAGTVTRWRRNTSSTSVGWANIDTGAEANSTQYYVYALADADATTFTVQISASSSAPTGATYYRKIGYFYNNASGNIVSVGNVKGGDVSNVVSVVGSTDISTTSAAYADMTDMVIYFVSYGRPARLTYSGPFYGSSDANYAAIAFDVDGTDVKESISGYYHSYGAASSDGTVYVGNLTSGTHTIKVQWKTTGTGYQKGATYNRQLIAEEL